MSCPTKFDTKDLFETMMLSRELSQAESVFKSWQAMADIGQDGWVQPGDYRYAVAFLEKRKEALAEAESAEDGRRLSITDLGTTKKSICNEFVVMADLVL